MSQFPVVQVPSESQDPSLEWSLSLNEEVPGSANESCCTATQSINVVIGVPWGPIQDAESS